MSASAVSSVWVVVIALTTSSMPNIHRPTEREPFCGCREMGFDQLRAAGGVDEPGGSARRAPRAASPCTARAGLVTTPIHGVPGAPYPRSGRHQVRPARLASATFAAFALIVAAGGATAAASPFTLGPDVKVSGGSTLTGCPFGASPDFANAYDNTEVEPQVAVNPTDTGEITGASQQDRWPDGGARGLTSWMSSDGGASWGKLPDVPWSACQGGPERFGRVTDPWVSYDAAGNLYFIGQPIDSAALGLSAISVTTWDAATSTWRPPRILIEDSGERGVFNDKVSITGDPTRPGYAYATWIRGDYPPGQRQSPIADFASFAYRGLPMISRTTNGGETWSTPKPMRRS